MAAGFLYVLINPSMPGLAKVGKTTRDPSTRVAELSGATGVATPFMLAYQQPVADCHMAESWVHNELERKGHRVASNREFFNAPLHEIVSLLNVAASIPAQVEPSDSEDIDTQPGQPDLAGELHAMGMKYFRGDGVIENKATALKYFQQVSAMGDPDGSTLAGICLHFGGPGLPKSLDRAMEFYRKAIDQGYWQAHDYVAKIFQEAERPDNEAQEWLAFFGKAALICERDSDMYDFVNEMIPSGACDYLRRVAVDLLPHVVPDEHIRPFAPAIVQALLQQRAEMQHYGQNGMALQFLAKRGLG